MESSNGVSPSATIIRVRRKRSAEPLSGLIVSTKRTRNDPSTANDERATENLFYRFAGTGKAPSECNELINREKVVEVLDFDVEKQAPTNKEIAVLDENYRKLMEAVKSVKLMEISDATAPDTSDSVSSFKEEKSNDVEMEAPPAMAPLAEPEDDSEYVYDFYWTKNSQVLTLDSVNVRLPTDDELKLYVGFDDIDDSNDEADDDSDSNAENYYKNEYPEEGQFENENENDTTSDESYDHYGDKYEEYEGYCYESSDE